MEFINMYNLRLLFTVTLALQFSPSLMVNHAETTLLWTERKVWADVRIMGIAGDPQRWVHSNNANDYTPMAQASPAGSFDRYKSYRVALAYQYSSQDLFFTDRGYKEIFRLHLQNITSGTYYSYNVTLQSLYKGTSANVYGLTVDWLSGLVYWTDSVYNWIVVADTGKSNYYKIIVTTGMEKPMGIAVHPHKGYLFWGDYGSNPRIERCLLDGTNRTTVYGTNLKRPLGMSIDFNTDRLYWVDDFKDSIEWINMDGGNHGEFGVGQALNKLHTLFGITVYKDLLFITDQLDMTIKAYNVTSLPGSLELVRSVMLDAGAIPYDIIVYDGTKQVMVGDSPCLKLSCDHFCLNMGSGSAKCTCKQGYELTENGFSCNPSVMQMPKYIYTIGAELCTTVANFVDRHGTPVANDVNCFLSNLTHVEALAFNSHSGMLYFSDTEDHAIYRLPLEVEPHVPQLMVAQTGDVRGISVDYINNNIYWTDQKLSHIMVSKLDGSYPHVLIDGLDSPKGIEVDPVACKLYWASPGNIYVSNLDGSGVASFANGAVRNPDGLGLDIENHRLFWADTESRTISYKSTANLTKPEMELFGKLDDGSNFRDVTVFKDYIAWTNGINAVMFGRIDKKDAGMLRGYNHPDMNVSHDIIMYDTSLQPEAPSPCDDDNGGCRQLCLPSGPKTKTCACGIGYYKKGAQCTSDIVPDNFVMFLDMEHKSVYQLDLGKPNAQVQAIALESAETPKFIAYNGHSHFVYWYDADEYVIRKVGIYGKRRAETVEVLKHDDELTGMSIDGVSYTLFFTDVTNRINKVNLLNNKLDLFYWSPSKIYNDSINVDPIEEDLYWLESVGGRKFISKMGMSGKNPMIHLQTIDKDPGLQGLEIDYHGRKIYAWSPTMLHRCNLDGSDLETLLDDATVHIHSVAVVYGSIYVSDYNRKSLLSLTYLGKNAEPIFQELTPDVFSRLQDVLAYRHFMRTTTVKPPKHSKPTPTHPRQGTIDPNGEANSGNGNSGNIGESTEAESPGSFMYMIIGIVAGTLVLLAIIIAVICIVKRRGRAKQPPPGDFNTPAHENPTYMSHREVERLPADIALEGAVATGEQEAGPLPEKKLDPALLVMSSGDPYASIIGPAVVNGLAPTSALPTETGSPVEEDAYMVPMSIEHEQLVSDALAEVGDSDVVLQVDDGKVAYSADKY